MHQRLVQRAIKIYTMRTAITTYTMLALALAGCAKSTPDVVLPPECRNFQLAIEDESVNIGRHFEAAIDALRAITNSDQRADEAVRAALKDVEECKVGPDPEKLRPSEGSSK